ncbi:M-spondin isoform X1 [Haemaphysalis longicornis]
MAQAADVRRLAGTLLLAWLAASEAPPSAGCPGLVQYRLTLATAWTASRFPRHYPKWRPPAQWSQLFGVSHNASLHLWRVGRAASEGVRQMAEQGRAGRLSGQLPQGFGGVFDVFHAPPIAKGSGASTTTFFADGRHSRVSAMSRLVPSPDWFVGVDSVELCEAGRWRDLALADAQLLDAGTDRGLTFTAPRWPAKPADNVTIITPQWPDHPGASFRYPHLKQLPRIGVFQFRRLRDYAAPAAVLADQPSTAGQHAAPVEPAEPSAEPNEPNGTSTDGHGSPAGVGSCQVSGWSSWSACSQTCGLGQSRRHRRILRYPQKGAAPCPPLHELRWCGSARACRKPDTYFRWNR